VTAGAGLQVATLVTFVDVWPSLVPIGELAAGVALLAGAVRLTHPWPGARLPTLVLLATVTAGGAAWALWLLAQGLFLALSLMAPAVAAAAAVVLLVGWGDIGRVGAVRAAAERETAKLIADAVAAGELAPQRRGWFLPVAFSVLSLPVGAFVVALFAPAALEHAEILVRGVLAGRSPFESGWVESATAYPYSGSPLLWYVDYEDRWVDIPKDAIEAFADGIAEDVAWKLAAETGEADPVIAEQSLWAAGRQAELPLWVADAIRARNVYYSAESLLSRSFDTDLHVVPGTIHLDCDQLVYVFLHVAWRLDLAMAAVPSPMHVYLRYGAPDGQSALYVETTRFRHIDVSGNRVDFLGAGIGEEFLIDADYHPSGRGGTWAAPDVVAAAALWQPWTERDIRDSIVGNVLVGVKRIQPDAPVLEELEARLQGTREIIVVTNLYSWYLERARSRRAEGDAEGARADATRAKEIRAQHPGLVIFTDPEEERILAELGGEGR
jgi:hypothetical protein